MNYGFKVTTHGRAVLTACAALGAQPRFTRAAVGSGRVGEGINLADVHQLIHYADEGTVGERRHEGDRLYLTVQYSNRDRTTGAFTLNEFILFAEDPVTGLETDFLYATLGDYPQGIPSCDEALPVGVWNFPLVILVSNELEVNVSASSGLVTWDDVGRAVQPKLTGQPGEVVGFDATGAAAAVRGWSNPDLLDNSHFYDPVNQQRQSEYISGGYTIDRWSATSGLIVLLEDGWIKLQNNTDSDQYFWQNLEPERFGLGSGNKVTLSTLYKSNVSGSRVILKYAYDDDWKEGFVFNANLGQTDGEFALGAVASNNALPSVNVKRFQLLFEIAPNSTLYLKTAKLELGSQQTLAHQDADGNWVLNDPPPNKALELLKCQRYYRVYATQSVRPNEALDCNPVMRINPTQTTIEINGATYYVNDANL